MRNIWITGAGGQLGRELQIKLKGRKGVLATDLEVDICDAGAVRRFMAENRIGTVINCAAYTNAEAGRCRTGPDFYRLCL